MGLILLDSSFAIALFTTRDQHHSAAIREYSDSHTYIASTVTTIEVMTGAIATGAEKIVWPRLKRLVSEFVAVDEPISLEAARLRSVGGLKTPDAIISATAQRRGAQLWTFDARLAKATRGARLLS